MSVKSTTFIVGLVIASPATAGTISGSSVEVWQSDNVAFGDSVDYTMPSFDTSLGRLTGVTVTFTGTESFDWPLFGEPGGSTLPIIVPIQFGIGIGPSGLAGGAQFLASPILWNATSTNYIYPGFTAEVTGSFADDPTLYTDSANPEILTIGGFGGFYTGSLPLSSGQFVTDFTDDATATTIGSLSTTFTFSVPEPSGFALFGFAALLLLYQRKPQRKL